MTGAIPLDNHKTPWLKEEQFFFSNFQNYLFTLSNTLHMKGNNVLVLLRYNVGILFTG